MKRVTDFKEWTNENVDLGDYEEVYGLHNAVENLSSEDGYEIKPGTKNDGEQYVLTNWTNESMLIINSEKARATFIDYIVQELMGGQDPESYLMFHRRIGRDDD